MHNFITTLRQNTNDPVTNQSIYKGNKSHLPSKLCTHCGLTMAWRRSWAKNWDSIKYCSDKCRKLSKALK
ncbi:MAG: DUF2256 domain-containing protein [Methylotenera sp.]|nr:DUF2256 domain-containing protein [Methylotenera sp.]MDD4926824.1 DUF2256 domain-containing protein [Methylotenera sp.]NOS96172.1 DUF2256 domain-containing protein [Methylotenera sp.]NOU41587.1 DUF2256 domain-containing protein [Methylotenera sp.]